MGYLIKLQKINYGVQFKWIATEKVELFGGFGKEIRSSSLAKKKDLHGLLEHLPISGNRSISGDQLK